MRHRQISGAGPLGTRTGIAIAVLVVIGLVCTVTVGQPAGLWLGYALSAGGAVLGFSGLWWRRGMFERQVKEMAKRRRADLARIAVAEQRHQAEAERLRTELEHEQQYSALVKDQLQRARRQLDEQRTARLTAEREIDALAAWLSEGAPTGPANLMVGNHPLLDGTLPDDPMPSAPAVEGDSDAADPDQSAQLSGTGLSSTGFSGSAETPAQPPQPQTRPVVPLADPSPKPKPGKAPGAIVINPAPGVYVSLPPEAAAVHRQRQKQSQKRERPAIVDRAAAAAAAAAPKQAPEAADDSKARAYRPFMDQHLANETVPESALAMAPVIDSGSSDAVLDLTAYDETVEFTVHEIRRRPTA
jgi:hypothetical protein